MVMFNSYVKLPEGTQQNNLPGDLVLSSFSRSIDGPELAGQSSFSDTPKIWSLLAIDPIIFQDAKVFPLSNRRWPVNS